MAEHDAALADANLKDSYADLAGVRLHYVEAGDGPLVVLLHGFPEYWYSWRHQIPALAAAGYRVVAPDMRGYNLSDKPSGWRLYDAGYLAGDVAGLIRSLGRAARTSWGTTGALPSRTRPRCSTPRSCAAWRSLTSPTRRGCSRGSGRSNSCARAGTCSSFRSPACPSWLIAREHFSFAKRSLRADSPGAFTDEDLERYVEAWSQPGALTGMINYYRAGLRQSPRKTATRLVPIAAPTMVIWGERDRYLGAEFRRAARAAGAGPAHGVDPRGDPLGPARRPRAGQRAARRLPARRRLNPSGGDPPAGADADSPAEADDPPA